MRRFFRIAALLLALGCVGWWVTAGRHTGWTKNTVREWHWDEITEISYSTDVPRFVPGVDFLAAGLGGALALYALSFVRLRKAASPA